MVVLLSLAACTDDTEYTAGVWYRRSDFDGVARTDAAGFTIGNVGYLCTGYRGSTKDRLKDCWAYDIEANSWTQCTSMPDAAPARNAATGFAVGTKGYIATGYDATKKDYLNDCWSMILPRIPGRRWLLFRMELMGLISMVNGIMRFLSALVSMGIWVQVTTIIIKRISGSSTRRWEIKENGQP